jgi:hypothetical protein
VITNFGSRQNMQPYSSKRGTYPYSKRSLGPVTYNYLPLLV